MCFVPGPDSQDTVFKREYASPGLQCSVNDTVEACIIGVNNARGLKPQAKNYKNLTSITGTTVAEILPAGQYLANSQKKTKLFINGQ
jgi:hypothetical protein